MQNHLEILWKSQFWIRNVEIGGKHKENIPFFKCMFMKNMLFSASRQRFLMVLPCSWVSWPKNDAERFRNYFKNAALDPKHAKFDQNPSFGHVRAVGGIMGYSGSVNYKHLLRYDPGSSKIVCFICVCFVGLGLCSVFLRSACYVLWCYLFCFW